MRRIAAFLAMEVDLAVASAASSRRHARTILLLNALHRRPGFDQRAVDGEVVGRQQPLDLGLGQDSAEKLRGDVAFKHSVSVFENTEWSQAAASIPMPTNQRNRRSYSSRSIKSRSERMD